MMERTSIVTRSIDGIMRVFYACLSGPPGVEPDWDRLRDLYVPNARLIPVIVDASGETSHQMMTVDEYITSRRSFLTEHGFREREVSRRSVVRDESAYVLSEYETRIDLDDPPIGVGVNSLQLVRDRGSWKIQTVLWAVNIPRFLDRAAR